MKSRDRDRLIALTLLTCGAIGCSPNQAVPPSPAERLDWIRFEIDCVDHERLRAVSAAQYEQTLTAALLDASDIVSCSLRLFNPHSCMGPATVDEPFYCTAILTVKASADLVKLNSLFVETFRDAGLTLRDHWPNPFEDQPTSDMLPWITESNRLGVDTLWAYPIGSDPTPLGPTPGFKPVEPDDKPPTP